MTKIFLSYRRDDAAADVTAIYQTLEREFGSGSLFKDVDNVPLGANWQDAIIRSLAECSVLLLIVGPEWTLTPAIELELRHALAEGIAIIPVLVRSTTIDEFHTQLPADLDGLTYLNVAHVDYAKFGRDMSQVVEAIKDHVGITPDSNSNTEATAAAHSTAEEAANNALKLAKMGRLQEAVDAFNTSLDQRPDDSEVLNNLGYTLNRLGRHREALAVLDRAIQLKPSYTLAHDNRATALHELGRSNDAEAAYRKARRTSGRLAINWRILRFVLLLLIVLAIVIAANLA